MTYTFNGWEDIARAVTIALLGYLAFALILRLSGKRTISKKNTFDLILPIAIGSLLGRTVLSPDAVLLEAVAALLVLVLMPALFTRLSTKQAGVRDLIHPPPTLLFYHGELLISKMHRERISNEDIREAVRSAGLSPIEEADAVVLEPHGKLSAIRKRASGKEDALGSMIAGKRDPLF